MKKLFKLGFVGLLLTVLIGTSSCYKKDIDSNEERITALEDALAALRSDVNALQGGAFSSIDWNAATGVLTLTNVDGTTKSVTIGPIPPTYEITLTGNTLLVNGVNKGQVTFPTQTLTLVDGYLWLNGANTNIAIPAATTPEELDLKVQVENGQYVFYNGTTRLGAMIPRVEYKDNALWIGDVKVLDTSDFLTEDAIIIQKNDEGTAIGVTLKVGDDQIYLPIVDQSIALASLNVIPTYIHNGMPAVRFFSLQEYKYSITGNNEKNEPVLNSYGLSSTPNVSFRYNPTGADVQNDKIEWSFINRGILTTRATGDRTNLISIVNNEDGSLFKMDDAGGAIVFKLIADETVSQYEEISFRDRIYDYMNLKAVAPVDFNDEASGKQDIVSPEVKVIFEEARAYIADQKASAAHPTVSLGEFIFPNIRGVANSTGAAALEVEYPFPMYAVAHEVAYDKSHDLLDYVLAIVEVDGVFYNFEDMDLTDYHFTFAPVDYTPTDNTNQAWFVNLVGSVFTIQDYAAQSAINRTPIFRANIVSNATGKIVATHFLKFVITPSAPTKVEWPVIDLGNIPYLSLYTQTGTAGVPGIPSSGPQLPLANELGLTVTGGTSGKFATPAYYTKLTSAPNITWQRINTDIYAALGMSHEEFLDNYDVDNVVIETDHTEKGKTGNPRVMPDRAIPVSDLHDENQGTSPLAFYIHPQTRFGEHTWTIVINRNDGRASVRIPVKFNITPPETPQFDPLYVANGVTEVMGKLYRTAPEQFLMQTTLSESFAGNPGGMMKDFESNVVNKIFALNTLPDSFNALGGTDDNITGFQTHRFAFGFSNVDATRYRANYTAKSTEGVGTTHNGQIFNYDASGVTPVQDVKSFLKQDIRLTLPIDVDRWNFTTVTFRSTYENMEDIDTKWTVRFINPIVIAVNNTTMATTSEPTIQLVRDFINTITVEGIQVYANGDFIINDSSVDLQVRYAIPNIELLGWKMDSGNRLGATSALFLSNAPTINEPIADYTPATSGQIFTLFWDNLGSALTQNVDNILNVTVETPYAIRKAAITVTVLK